MIGFTLQYSSQTRSADTLFAADWHSDTGFVQHLYDGSTRWDREDLAGAAQLYFEGSACGSGVCR